MKQKLILLLGCYVLIQSSTFLLNGCGGHCNTECYFPVRASLIPMDNSGAVPVLLSNNSVLASACMLVFSLEDTLKKCVKNDQPFSWISTAQAECVGHQYGQAMDTFNVTSDHDFDAAHPAGTSLNNLFKRKNLVQGGGFNLLLLQKPSDTGTHVFKIKWIPGDTIYTMTAVTQPTKLLI